VERETPTSSKRKSVGRLESKKMQRRDGNQKEKCKAAFTASARGENLGGALEV